MRVVILAAGAVYDPDTVRTQLGCPDFVICADGGVRHALMLGLTPDLVLGDFDSVDPALLEEIRAQAISVQRFPVEKDQTDTHLALDEALRRGATEILLVGATGERLDHVMANVLLLPTLPPGVDLCIADGKNLIRLLRPGERIVVRGNLGDILSLLPLSPLVEGVVAEGVRWPLYGASLRWGESLGVSNQLTAPEASIATTAGYLLVMTSRD